MDVLSHDVGVSGEPNTVWTVPSGATPVAVAQGLLPDSEGLSSPTVVALTCSEAGGGCSLLRGDAQADALSPWPASELPDDFVVSGMVIDTASTEPRVCVYGNGLLCLGDGWQPEIPTTADLRLNHVSIGWFWSLAVGEQGRWYKRQVDDTSALSSWEEQPPLGSVSLTYASAADLGGVILGEGKIQAALGTQARRAAHPRRRRSLASSLAHSPNTA